MYRFWNVCLVLGLIFLQAVSGGAAAGDLSTQPHSLGGKLTSMALSEDGRMLVAAQQELGRVHFLDVESGRLLQTAACPDAAFVLVRGTKAYVLNRRDGVIHVYRIDDPACAEVDQLMTGSKSIRMLSAPTGTSFAGLLLATSHEGDDFRVHLISETHDQAKLLQKPHSLGAVCWTADGQFVVQQGSFSYSPSGIVEAMQASDYLKLSVEPKPEPRIRYNRYNRYRRPEPERSFVRGEHESTPWLIQVRPGELFYGPTDVYSGIPPKALSRNLGKCVVPDQTTDYLYVVEDNEVRAYLATTRLQPAGRHAIEWSKQSLGLDIFIPDPLNMRVKKETPSSPSRSPLPGRISERENNVVACRPVAATLNGRTHIFVPAPEHDGLLEIRTPAFDGSVAADPGASAADLAGSEPAGADRQTVREIVAELRNVPGVHPVAGKECWMATARSGDSLLLLDSAGLRLLDAHGGQVIRELELSKHYLRIGERPGIYIALARRSVDFLDRTTGEILGSTELPEGAVGSDLVLDPVTSTTYVAAVT